MRKKNLVAVFTVLAVLFFIGLVVQNISKNNKIAIQTKKLHSLSVELTQALSNVSVLRADSAKKVMALNLLRKTVENSEEKNDSLVQSINVLNRKLASETANISELQKKITFLNNELEAEKSVEANLQNDIDNATKKAADLQNKYDDAVSRFKHIEPELKSKSSELEDLRRSFAPRLGVYTSGINTEDCQELYKAIRPYMPKVSDNQLQTIFSEEGKNLRSISRKLNCPDLENLYLFLIAAGLNPKSATIEEVREPFRQTILSGDFSRIAVSAFEIDPNTVERAITVAKSVYKF